MALSVACHQRNPTNNTSPVLIVLGDLNAGSLHRGLSGLVCTDTRHRCDAVGRRKVPAPALSPFFSLACVRLSLDRKENVDQGPGKLLCKYMSVSDGPRNTLPAETADTKAAITRSAVSGSGRERRQGHGVTVGTQYDVAIV
ncbi:hypothetical protein J6590_063966 [Homalodisca vitripennis]|nr:hypothetical protein J6590_063966 [Homalodisca vitripennis]